MAVSVPESPPVATSGPRRNSYLVMFRRGFLLEPRDDILVAQRDDRPDANDQKTSPQQRTRNGAGHGPAVRLESAHFVTANRDQRGEHETDDSAAHDDDALDDNLLPRELERSGVHLLVGGRVEVVGLEGDRE